MGGSASALRQDVILAHRQNRRGRRHWSRDRIRRRGDRAMSMEGRMTVCNMSMKAARVMAWGPDDTTTPNGRPAGTRPKGCNGTRHTRCGNCAVGNRCVFDCR